MHCQWLKSKMITLFPSLPITHPFILLLIYSHTYTHAHTHTHTHRNDNCSRSRVTSWQQESEAEITVSPQRVPPCALFNVSLLCQTSPPPPPPNTPLIPPLPPSICFPHLHKLKALYGLTYISVPLNAYFVHTHFLRIALAYFALFCIVYLHLFHTLSYYHLENNNNCNSKVSPAGINKQIEIWNVFPTCLLYSVAHFPFLSSPFSVFPFPSVYPEFPVWD